jgi:hypothetical protein
VSSRVSADESFRLHGHEAGVGAVVDKKLLKIYLLLLRFGLHYHKRN